MFAFVGYSPAPLIGIVRDVVFSAVFAKVHAAGLHTMLALLVLVQNPLCLRSPIETLFATILTICHL